MAQRKKPTIEETYDFPYLKPEKKSAWLTMIHFIYNPETNSYLGRTPLNWCSIILFYTLFFTALAIMFSICMYGLLQSLSKERPTYVLESSIIGANPGLGYRPLLHDVEKSGSLIWYNAQDADNIKVWTSLLDEFLEGYDEDNKRQTGKNRVTCDFDRPAPPGKVCDVSLDAFGPCSKANGYSYNQSAPCIFIKLNRIFDWVPDLYNDTAHLPENMDEDLKKVIRELPAEQRNMIWVTCHGENVADRELIGELEYYPFRGFPAFYYPYTNFPGYLSPLVAVHFKRPIRSVMINVECRAWAKNIIVHKYLFHREGSVHFELLVD